jgi:hypothetical protein
VKSGEEGPPVALRWCSIDLLGFPRVPFEVFRHTRQRDKFEALVTTPVTFTGSAGFVEWQLREMFGSFSTAAPDPGSTLIVEAVKQQPRTHSRPAHRFHHDGKRSLYLARHRGTARRGPRKNPERAVASIRSSTRTTRTGSASRSSAFRLRKANAGTAYDGAAFQGIEPPSLPGIDFAKARLQIAELLHLAIPPTGVADIPNVEWPAPDPGGYLNELHDAIHRRSRLCSSV